MQLPFTIEQFYGVFRDYNTTVCRPKFFWSHLLSLPLRWWFFGVVGLAQAFRPSWPFYGLGLVSRITSRSSPPSIPGPMPSLVYRWQAPLSFSGKVCFAAGSSSG
jgi:hypothetical protein